MKRVVIKFGTGVLSKSGGTAPDPQAFRRIAEGISALHKKRYQVVVVSSGAIAAGVHALGFKERPTDLALKQACAAAGQPSLMHLYTRALAKYQLQAAQLLLTHGDLDSRARRTNARRTLECLLSSKNIIPIINENDSVATDEIRVGDNDRLSADVAELCQADLLGLFTSAPGLMNGDRRIPVVKDLETAFQYVRAEKGTHSVGGMQSKLEAVRIAHQAGIAVVIADGRAEGEILSAITGRNVGTRFPIASLPQVQSIK